MELHLQGEVLIRVVSIFACWSIIFSHLKTSEERQPLKKQTIRHRSSLGASLQLPRSSP